MAGSSDLTAKFNIEAELRDWFLIHDNLCIALGHPLNRSGGRHTVAQFVRQLGNTLVDLGVMAELHCDAMRTKAGIDGIYDVIRDEVDRCEHCQQVLIPHAEAEAHPRAHAV